MRLFQRLAVVFLVLWAGSQLGCNSNEEPILPAELVITYSGSNVVTPRSKTLFSANMDVRWIAADSAGGSIDDEGLYTAPNRIGNFRVTAVSKEDPTRSGTVEMFVTPRAEQFRELQNGGLVVYFRHVVADSGIDLERSGPNWWKTCNPDTVRILGQTGREQARITGTVFWRMGIPGSEFITSEFCRCIQTAEEMNFGGLEIRTDSALTAIAYGEQDRHARTLELVSRQTPGPGQVVVMISHEFAPGFQPLPQLAQGDAVVFRPVPGGEPEYLGRIETQSWVGLYRE